MTIQECIKEYTAGNRIVWREVVAEIWELLAEVFKLNKEGIKEERGDVFHFMQL